jgi:predicted protein tyrosine phosphatase
MIGRKPRATLLKRTSMSLILRRHEAKTNDKYIALRNGGSIFIMPKFNHLMMDNRLIEIDIPKEYYRINREAIESMAKNTKLFIQNLREI